MQLKKKLKLVVQLIRMNRKNRQKPFLDCEVVLMDHRYLANMRCFLRDEHGATAVEYSMMLVLIILVCIVAVGYLGESTEGAFNKFLTTLNSLTN